MRFILAMQKPDVPDADRIDARAPTAGALAQDLVSAAWDAFHDELYGFLFGATRDADTAEDLLEECYLRLLRECRAGRAPEQVRPWLYRVCTNLVISRGRRVASARQWFERIGVPGARMEAAVASPEETAVRRESTAELEAALAVLRPDARTALLLASAGFTGHEIASLIGRTDVGTRTLMCRARLQLRQRLAAGGVL